MKRPPCSALHWDILRDMDKDIILAQTPRFQISKCWYALRFSDNFIYKALTYELLSCSFSMHLVPKPGWSSKASSRFSMAGFPRASLLYTLIVMLITRYNGHFFFCCAAADQVVFTLRGKCGGYLKKVYCSPYIHGCNCRAGYFPKGGTMRLKSRATSTNTAGRTI